MKPLRLLVWALALCALAYGLIGLKQGEDGVSPQQIAIGAIPATLFAPPDGGPAKAIVLVAHGFAGSQQMMAPIATTLARNGYVAVTFDFSGHGRNLTPMPGGLAKLETSTAALLKDIDEVVRFARVGPGRMDALRWSAIRWPRISSCGMRAAIRRSPRSPRCPSLVRASPATSQKSLIIDGAWESQRLIEAGVRVVSQSADAPAQAGVTYGDIAGGTGRRLAIARGVEHIGVLYSRDAMTEILNWMNAVFGRSEAGDIDARGPWLALLFAGLVALMWPLAQLLPRVSPNSAWRRAAMAALSAHRDSAALLTPLILWKAPTDFLPILLGDYLVAHLALYGADPLRRPVVRTGRLAPSFGRSAGSLCLSQPLRSPLCTRSSSARRSRPMSSLTCRRAFAAPLVPIMFIGCALYFLADEWLTRGPGAAPGGYLFSKFCFIASLGVAVALNPRRLFFLVIIAIVIVILLDGLWARREMGLCAHARSPRRRARRSLRPRLGARRHVPDRRLEARAAPTEARDRRDRA